MPPNRETYTSLRAQALTSRASDIGLARSREHPNIWGALMEFGLANGTATIVAIADGTVSLYLSTGGGVIGAGGHKRARDAATAFITAAETLRDAFSPTDVYPTPPAGVVRFFALDFEGVSSVDAMDTELMNPTHELHHLYARGQDVLSAIIETGPK